MAWAENEWSGKKPWNEASSRTLEPDASLTLGVRFSVAEGGVRDLDSTGHSCQSLRPGPSTVNSTTVEPTGALELTSTGDGNYTVTPSTSAWGSVRLTVDYADGKMQTIHYHATKPGTEVVASLGQFLTTDQWFDHTSDPFGRALSIYRQTRFKGLGLSDEGGSGSFLAACMKHSAQPNEDETTMLESFIDGVLWKTIQASDFAVRKSIFFYEPAGHPGTKHHLMQLIVPTTMFMSQPPIRVYIMQEERTLVSLRATLGTGETIFGEILTDLTREGLSSQAQTLTATMKSQADQWDTEA
ncbi:hypothetical protein ACLOAV_001740 [Pseudogymnoascus australis]